VASRDYSTLIYLGAAAVVGYFVVRSLKASAAVVTSNKIGESGTTSGGLLPGVGSILAGESQFSQTVAETTLPAGSGAVAPASGGGSKDPLAYISGGITNPTNGGSVKRALFSDTVRMVAELVNSGNADWSGEFRLEVDEDYLLKDSKGTYSRVVTVPANRALRLDIDYLLRGGTQLREPNLFVNVFAGTKYLGQHKVVVT
jgi:hypothetical protein|tara:strand:- start:646 stop:1248 length:603 start_codon:yes stop_codon:yes gene_type:complete